MLFVSGLDRTVQLEIERHPMNAMTQIEQRRLGKMDWQVVEMARKDGPRSLSPDGFLARVTRGLWAFQSPAAWRTTSLRRCGGSRSAPGSGISSAPATCRPSSTPVTPRPMPDGSSPTSPITADLPRHSRGFPPDQVSGTGRMSSPSPSSPGPLCPRPAPPLASARAEPPIEKGMMMATASNAPVIAPAGSPSDTTTGPCVRSSQFAAR